MIRQLKFRWPQGRISVILLFSRLFRNVTDVFIPVFWMDTHVALTEEYTSGLSIMKKLLFYGPFVFYGLAVAGLSMIAIVTLLHFTGLTSLSCVKRYAPPSRTISGASWLTFPWISGAWNATSPSHPGRRTYSTPSETATRTRSSTSRRRRCYRPKIHSIVPYIPSGRREGWGISVRGDFCIV